MTCSRSITEYRQKVRHHSHRPKAKAVSKKEVLIWAPALAMEPIAMLIQWIRAVEAAGFVNAVLVFNGSGSERACKALRKEVISHKIMIKWLSGPASIGTCQAFVTHLFLKSRAKYIFRVDPDGQFPIKCIERLLRLFEVTGSVRPDVIMGQRDEAGVAGRTRFLGNVVLRLLAMHFANFADPNCGLYVMNRKAAAILCGVPLPKYPESRMLMAFWKASLTVATCVVPTLRRQAGRSSIRGLRRNLRVFFGSFLEMLSWDSL